VTHPTPEDIRASVVAAASESGLVFDEPGDDVRAVTLEAVSAMVHQTLTGEFGEVAPGDSLATVGAKRWLAEVGFDFTTRGVVRLADVVEIAARHLHNDPLFSSWLAQLDVDESVFRGMITGSIDAVVAVGDDTDARFLVLDFKTNNLGPVGPDGYDPTVLRAAMSRHHYQLQALLYLVALHRYLRQRLGSRYDYERHVLGAAYLFVRSMVPGRPGSGVLTLRPPAACIEELSELLEACP
jgi:exodeoxyribonuclease V beta subunit